MPGELDVDAYERMQRVGPEMADPLKVAIELRVRLHVGGALSVEGPIADKAFCRRLLDEAWDAINRQGANRPALVVPGCDTDIRALERYG